MKNVKLAITTAGVAALIAAALLLPVVPWLVSLFELVGNLGAWGPVALGSFYIIACLFLVPASIPTLAAGFLFGVLVGSVTAMIGSTAGACLAFLAGRLIARSWVAGRIAHSRRYVALDRAIGRHGFKVVLLSRLSPISPFILLNYIFGLTRVSFWEYTLGTLIGMAPGTILFVYLGAGLRSLTEVVACGAGEAWAAAHPAFFWAGLAVTVAVTILLARMAHATLRKYGAADEDGGPRSH